MLIVIKKYEKKKKKKKRENDCSPLSLHGKFIAKQAHSQCIGK
jgi:hypothetical protein